MFGGGRERSCVSVNDAEGRVADALPSLSPAHARSSARRPKVPHGDGDGGHFLPAAADAARGMLRPSSVVQLS